MRKIKAVIQDQEDQGAKKPGFSVSVVIPTWNGIELLRENLPSVEAATRKYRDYYSQPTEIIVVDDGSQDETQESLESEFASVRLIKCERNRGFAIACNVGFEHCRYDLVALLNNDVSVSPEYLIHKAPHFKTADVFAVTAKVFEWDQRIFTAGGRYGRFRRGFWSFYSNYDVTLPEAGEWVEQRRLLSACAIGGFATYDRMKLIELGGFDELLSPFHWEDVELSYRGWKRGWEVRYEPRSQARHRTSATIDAHYRKKMVDRVSLRNRLLFHWINLHSTTYLVKHCLMLLMLSASRLIVLDHHFYWALGSALSQLGKVRRRRREEKSRAKRSDREVDRFLQEFYSRAPIQVYYNQQEVIESHPDFQ